MNRDYVQELQDKMKQDKFEIFGKDLSNPEIAKELLTIEEYLEDPYNRLKAMVHGHCFLKEDYIRCTEDRYNIVEGKRVPPNDEEKYRIMKYKTDIELFNKCLDMIDELRNKL